MSNGGPTTDARKALGTLLTRLTIAKVVCVDDEHASALKLDDILAWLETASPDDVADTFPEFEGRTLPDRDVRKEKFRIWWESLSSPVKEQISGNARSQIQQKAREDSPDIDYMSVLSEVFEGMDGIEFVPLGPKEWRQQSAVLLASEDCTQTLFLFDQDMSKQEGRTNEGSAIVGSILAGQGVAPLCGILTHTAALDSQVQRWEQLAEEAGVDRDRFMVIPKSLLTDDLTEFTRQMKSAVLAPSFRKLKELSSNILTASLNKAKEQLEGLTVLDFDHMVMRVARGEGVWEGQVLFRLHAHYHRLEAEQQARSDTSLADLIGQIRKVSHIPDLGKSKASSVVREIRHTELYEAGATVNAARLDIATGDIFEATSVTEGAKARWMVASQACDLAMRPDGERNVEHALLLSIVQFSESKWKKDGRSKSRYMELEYFDGIDANVKLAVDFLATSFVPCWMLDTCVLNGLGECGIGLDAELPGGLLPGWRARFAQVIAEAQKLHDQCNVSCVANEEDRRDLLTRLAPPVTSCGSIRSSIQDAQIVVPLRRIMRLRIEMAMEVVRRYAAYIARTPHEVDLARQA